MCILNKQPSFPSILGRYNNQITSQAKLKCDSRLCRGNIREDSLPENEHVYFSNFVTYMASSKLFLQFLVYISYCCHVTVTALIVVTAIHPIHISCNDRIQSQFSFPFKFSNSFKGLIVFARFVLKMC